ncbi:MAG: hypothetical protein WDA09_03060 [Bacteriovoracaceae bacterium]
MIQVLFILIISLNVFALDDRELLKDLPALTPENIRWNIPADAWRSSVGGHSAKGKLFRFEASFDEGYESSVYANKELEGEPLKPTTAPYYLYKKKAYCTGGIGWKPDPSKNIYYQCNRYSCLQFSKEMYSGFSFNTNYGSYSAFLLDPKVMNRENCPYKMEYYVKAYYPDDDSKTIYHALDSPITGADRSYDFYFRYEGIDKDRNYLEVKVNDKIHYLDIRACKKNPKRCEEVNIEFSDYEKDWIAMKKHQKNKDLEVLNIMIKELKPCVLKRDIPCMKKFLATKENEPGLAESYKDYVYPVIEKDNDVLFKELEACLDYDKLLPHLYGTRGIDRVCMIGDLKKKSLTKEEIQKMYKRGELRIMGVAFPEAVRIGGSDDIFYAP